MYSPTLVFFCRSRRPPESTRTDTLLPFTTPFRSPIDAPSRPSFPTQPDSEGIVNTTVPFLDLVAQQRGIRAELHAAVTQVLDSGNYVLGEHVRSEEHTSELQSLMRI